MQRCCTRPATVTIVNALLGVAAMVAVGTLRLLAAVRSALADARS